MPPIAVTGRVPTGASGRIKEWLLTHDQNGLDGSERSDLAASYRLVQQEFEKPSLVLGLARDPGETAGDLDPRPADRDREDWDAKANRRIHDLAHEFRSLLVVHSR